MCGFVSVFVSGFVYYCVFLFVCVLRQKMSVCKKNAFSMYINHCANIYISKIVANEDLEEA